MHSYYRSDKVVRKNWASRLPDRIPVEGDLYSSQCYRAIFEAANKARPRNAGTHLWK